jgi:hypothetical protein
MYTVGNGYNFQYDDEGFEMQTKEAGRNLNKNGRKNLNEDKRKNLNENRITTIDEDAYEDVGNSPDSKHKCKNSGSRLM